VVTCDRDLLALAHGGIEVLLEEQHRSGPGRRYDAAAVTQRIGIDPRLHGEWRALVGDRADGLPGVPDLHPRDAARLIREWGSAGALLAGLRRVRPPALRARLAACTERIALNARVLPLREDVPLA
jgi:DNA polymerase-1